MQGPLDPAADPAGHRLSLFDRAILARLDEALEKIDAAYEGYRFSEVAQSLYDFVWGEFCDRYIEVAKADFRSEDPARRQAALAVIDCVLKRVLQLLHPFAPFITEELWQGLGLGQQTIQFEPWPTPGRWKDPAALEMTTLVFEAITAARNLRTTYNLPANKPLAWLFKAKEPWAEAINPALSILLNASSLETITGPAPAGSAVSISSIGELVLPLEGLIDPATERSRLQKECLKVEAEIEKVARKLASESFVNHAPPEVITEHRERQTHWVQRMEDLNRAIATLG